MAKVYVSYVLNGAIELDIPNEILTKPDDLREYIDTHFENVDSQTLLSNLDYDADSIVKSVFDSKKTYLGF